MRVQELFAGEKRTFGYFRSCSGFLLSGRMKHSDISCVFSKYLSENQSSMKAEGEGKKIISELRPVN